MLNFVRNNLLKILSLVVIFATFTTSSVNALYVDMGRPFNQNNSFSFLSEVAQIRNAFSFRNLGATNVGASVGTFAHSLSKLAVVTGPEIFVYSNVAAATVSSARIALGDEQIARLIAYSVSELNKISPLDKYALVLGEAARKIAVVGNNLQLFTYKGSNIVELAAHSISPNTFSSEVLAYRASDLASSIPRIAKIDLPTDSTFAVNTGSVNGNEGMVLGAFTTAANVSSKNNLPFLDQLSLSLYCSLSSLSTSLDKSRCNYDLLASGLITSPVSSNVANGTDSQSKTVATNTQAPAPLTPTFTGAVSPTYITQYITKYVPVAGPAGTDGRNGKDGVNGLSAKESQGGFGGFVNPTSFAQGYTPFLAQSLIGVSTIGYLKDTTIDYATLNYGTSTNLYLANASLSGAVFNGSNVFNGTASFTGTVNVNELTAASSTFTNSTTTNAYIANLSIGSSTISGAASFGSDVTISGALSVVGTSTLATTTITIATIGDLVVTNSSTTNATTTNSFISSLTATLANITDLIIGNATTTNFAATNASTTNLTALFGTTTNSFTENATTTNGFFTNLFATLANITDLIIGNSTTTNAIVQNSTTTNAYIQNLSIGTSSSNGSISINGNLNVNGTSTLATTTTTSFTATQATTTSLYATYGTTVNGSSTNFFTQNLSVGSGQVAGNQNINGELTVNGTTTLGNNTFLQGSVTLGTSTSNYITVNGLFNSNLVPAANITYDLGSPSFYWRNGYLDSLTVNHIYGTALDVSSTNSSTFTVNSDNGTTDGEDASLVFFRGLVTPNAVIRWNSAVKRLESNMSFRVMNETPVNGTTTLTVQGGAGQGTTNLFELVDNSGNKMSAFDATGRLGIGTSTPLTSLHIVGTDAVVIPVGTTAQRPTSSTTGMIRYNSSNTTFEGFNGTTWGSLGGVIDTNMDTYVSAENTPGANNDELKFFTFGQQRGVFSSNGNFGIGTTTPGSLFSVNGNSYFGGNIYATGTLNILGNTILTNASTTGVTATNIFTTNLYASTSVLTNASTTGITATRIDTNIINASSALLTLASTSQISASTGATIGALNITGTSKLTGAVSASSTLDVTGQSRLYGTLNLLADILPTTDITRSIGSNALRFLNLFSQNIYASSSVVTNASSTGLTATNLYSTLANITNASTTGVTATNIFTTNLYASSSMLTNASTTNITSGGTIYGSTVLIGGAVPQYDDAKLVVSGTSTFLGSASSPTAIRAIGNIDNTATSTVSPTLLSTLSIGGVTRPYFIYTSGQYAYITNDSSSTMSIVDISSPASPTVLSTLSTGSASQPHSVYVSGSYAYVANNGADNMAIIDVSNKASPSIVSTLNIGSAGSLPNGIYGSGRYVYVVSSDATITIVDVYNPVYPVIKSASNLGVLSNPQSVYVSGRYAYIANYGDGKLVVADISNPSSPVLSSTISFGISSSPNSVYVSGRYAYVANSGTDSMSIVDISNPTALSLASTTSTGGTTPNSVYVSGRYAYVANGNGNNLAIIDVSNPTSPVLVSTPSTGSRPISVAVSGRYAYVANYTSNTMSVFDVGGLETTSALVHSLEAGNLSVRNDIVANGNIFGSGLSVGANGFQSQGNSSVYGSFSVGTSSRPLFLADSYNSRVNIGTSTGAATLFVQGTSTANPFVVASSTGASLFTVNALGGVLASSTLAITGTTTQYGTLSVLANILPTTDITRSIGSNSLRFLNLFSQNIYASSSVVTNASSTGLTATNLYSTLANITNASTTGVTATNIFTTNLYASTSVLTLASSTALTSTTLYSTLANITNASTTGVTATNIFTTNLYASTSVLTNASTTNITSSGTLYGTNVMIGTTTPTFDSAKLVVQGTSTFVGTTASPTAIRAIGNIDNSATSTFAPKITASTTTNSISSIAVQGKYAYIVSAASGTIQVVDVSNPTSPLVLSTTTLTTNAAGVLDILVSGRYAYIRLIPSAGGNGTIYILDVSDPVTPVVTFSGSLGINQIGTATEKLAISGKYLYFNDWGVGLMKIFDVSNPYAPVQVGSVSHGGTFGGIDVLGKYAYLYSTFGGGLRVIDVSNPTAPVITGTLSLGVFAGSVTVSGRYAYVPYGTNLYIVDISSSTLPVLRGTVTVNSNSAKVYVSGRYVYSLAATTLQVIDVASSTAPRVVSTLSSLTAPSGFAVSGHYAYYGDGTSFNVLDLGGVETTSAIVHSLEAGNLVVRDNIFANGNTVTTGLTVGTAGFLSQGYSSVYGSFAVTGTSTFATTTTSLLNVAGDILPTSNIVRSLGTNALRFLNLFSQNIYASSSQVTNASSTGLTATNLYFTNASSTGGLTLTNLFGTNIYASTSVLTLASTSQISASIGATLAALNVTGNASTTALSATTFSSGNTGINGTLNVTGQSSLASASTTNLTSSGNFYGANAFIGGSVQQYDSSKLVVQGTSTFMGTTASPNAIRAIGNIDNTASTSVVIKLISSISTGGAQSSVYVQNKYAYVTNSGLNTLAVVDVSNPLFPVVTGTTSVGTTPAQVVASGNYAYVVSTTGLSIVDISNPSAPVLATTTAAGIGNSIAVSGQFAYIATGSTMRVIDISNPYSPRSFSTVSAGSNPNKIAISGKYAYLTDTGSGLLAIMDISNPSAPFMVSNTASTGATPSGIAVSGRYVYTSGINSSAFYITDVSNPAIPVFVASSSPISFNASGIAVFGRYIILLNQAGSLLHLFDVSSSSNPILISSANPGGTTPNSVFVSGRYAYVSNAGGQAMGIFDLGGLETTSAMIHSLEAGNLLVRNDIFANGSITAGTGLNVGAAGLFSAGAGSFNVSTTSSLGSVFALSASLRDNSTTSILDVISLSRGSSGTSATGIGTGLLFSAQNSSGNMATTSRIASILTGTASGSEGSALSFFTRSSGSSLLERMRLTDTGALFLGTTTMTSTSTLFVQGSSTQNILTLASNTGAPQVTVNSLGDLLVGTTTATFDAASLVVQGTSTFIGTTASPTAIRAIGNIDNTATSSIGLKLMSNWASPSSTGGSPTLVVQNNYTYFMDNGVKFYTVDTTNKSSPVFVSSTTVPSGSAVYAVSGKYAYLNNGTTLTILDISNASSTVTVSSTAAGGTVAVNGNYVYVGGSSLLTYDISNPTYPRLVSTLSGIQAGNGLRVYGNYAFGVSRSGSYLSIMDISNPMKPTLASTTILGSSNNMFGNVFISGRYAFVQGGNADITVVDISNPSIPFIATSSYVGLSAGTFNLTGSGRYVYTSTYGGTINVVDVSNPLSPVLVSTNASGANLRFGMTVSGRYLYQPVESGLNGFKIFDVGGFETTAAMIHSLEAGNLSVRNDIFAAGNVTVGTGLSIGNGGFLSQGNSAVNGNFTVGTSSYPLFFANAGTNRINVGTSTGNATLFVQGTSTDNPFVVASSTGASMFTVNAFGGVLASYFSSQNIYASSSVITNASTTNITSSGTLYGTTVMIGTTTPTFDSAKLVVQGTSTFIGTTASPTAIRAIGNIDNTATSTVQIKLATSTYVGGTSVNSVAVSGRYVYTVNVSNSSMSIVDVSNPSFPATISTTSVASGPVTVALSGNYAYVLSQTAQVVSIINITNPKAPTVISTVSTDSVPTRMFISGHYVFVANNNSGFGTTVNIIDVSNPSSPVRVSNITTPFSPYSVAVSGKYAYVFLQSGSLYVIDITNPAGPVTMSTTALSSSFPRAYVSGRYLYVGNFNGNTNSTIDIVDVSNPSSPVIMSTISMGGLDITSVFASGRYLYAVGSGYVPSSISPSISVIDVSSSTAPVIISTQTMGSLGSGGSSVVVSGRYAYVGTGSLSIYDIGGLETTSAIIHSLEAGNLSVRNDISASGNISAGTSLTVGTQGIFSSGSGAFTLYSTSTLKGSPALSLSITDSSSSSIVDVLSIFKGSTTTAATSGIGSGILFSAQNASGNIATSSRIASILTNTTNGSEASALTFYTRTSGAAIAERARITGEGYLYVGTTTSSGSSTLLVQGMAGINPFTVASSTGTSLFSVFQNGSVNIGTTTSTGMLTLQGTAGVNIFNFSSSTGSTLLTLNQAGALLFGTTTYAGLQGEIYANFLTTASTTATTTLAGNLNVGSGGIVYDASSTVTSISSLESGNLSFDTNAGSVSWVDLPVTSAATVGTVESYSAQMAGNPVLTVYAESDGVGGVRYPRIGIGTSTPSSTLDVYTSTSSSNVDMFRLLSDVGGTAGVKFRVDSDGDLFVSGSTTLATTTTSLLSVAGNIMPTTDITRSIGSNALRFLNLFSQNIYASSSVMTYATSTNFAAVNASSTNLFAYNASTTNITSSGTLYGTNVMIGTTTPTFDSAKLVVQGTSTFIGTTASPTAIRAIGNIDNTATSSISIKSVGSWPSPTTTNTSPTLVVQNNYTYFMDNLSTFYTVDTTNKSSPLFVSSTTVPSGSSVYAVAGKYAYLASTNVVTILDISNASSTVTVSSTTIPSTIQGGLALSGNYLYIGGNNFMYVLDVSNPTYPRIVYTISSGTFQAGNGLRIYGKYAYGVSRSGSQMSIIDISNPIKPTIASTTILGSSNNMFGGIYVSGRYAFVQGGNADMTVVDISNPSIPFIATSSYTMSGGSVNLTGSGRYVYLSSYSGNVQIIDVINPLSPVIVSTASSLGGLRSGITISGRYLYQPVEAALNGFKIFDVGGLETTSAIVHSLEAGNLSVRNDIFAAGNVTVGTGLSIGNGGFLSQGNSAVNGNFTVGTSSYPLFFANAGLNNINIGTSTGAATLFVQGTSTANPFVVASSTGTSLFTILANGNVGIGTSSPVSLFSVLGTSTLNGAVNIGTTTSTGMLTLQGTAGVNIFNFSSSTGSTLLTLNQAGALLFGTTTYAGLQGEIYANFLTTASTTATTTLAGNLNVGSGGIVYDASSTVTSISSLEIGNMSFDTNAGIISWTDLPVTSAAATGTVESYTAQIGGSGVLTVYSESNGIGGTRYPRIGINTSTPGSALDVYTATSTSNVDLFRLISDVGSTANVKFRVDSDGDIFTDGGTTVGSPADIAENYTALEAVDAGTVVAFGTTTENWNQVTESSTTTDVYAISGVRKAAFDYEAVGIISTKAGITLGGNTTNGVSVAFVGRVPVKVTTENGVVARGDYLTVSKTIPGYAMKLTGEGRAIGRALSDYAAGKDKVMVMVENGYQRLDLAGKTATTSAMLTTGNLDLNANGVAITNIKSLASANGSWSIDENGRIVAKVLCLEDVCIDKTQLSNILNNTGTQGMVAGTSTNGAAGSQQSTANSTSTTDTGTTTPPVDTSTTTPPATPPVDTTTPPADTTTPPADTTTPPVVPPVDTTTAPVAPPATATP